MVGSDEKIALGNEARIIRITLLSLRLFLFSLTQNFRGGHLVKFLSPELVGSDGKIALGKEARVSLLSLRGT